MDTRELFCLLKKEAERFSAEDIIKRAAVGNGQSSGSLERLSPLSRYDLEALLEIKSGSCPEIIEDVDAGKLNAFVWRIDRYMDENAPDRPDLKRYIRMISTYLAFIIKKPLHLREWSCPAASR